MDLKNNNLGRISLKVVGQDGNEFLALINVNKRIAIFKQMFADRLVSCCFVYFVHIICFKVKPYNQLQLWTFFTGCSFRYLFDGKRISDDETPAEVLLNHSKKQFSLRFSDGCLFYLICKLQMENGDIIEVYQEQIGGFL